MTETTYSNGLVYKDTLTSKRVYDPAPIDIMPRNETGKVYTSLDRQCTLGNQPVGRAKLYATFLFDHDNQIAEVDYNDFYCTFDVTCEVAGLEYKTSSGGKTAFVRADYILYWEHSVVGGKDDWMKIECDYDGYTTKTMG